MNRRGFLGLFVIPPVVLSICTVTSIIIFVSFGSILNAVAAVLTAAAAVSAARDMQALPGEAS